MNQEKRVLFTLSKFTLQGKVTITYRFGPVLAKDIMYVIDQQIQDLQKQGYFLSITKIRNKWTITYNTWIRHDRTG